MEDKVLLSNKITFDKTTAKRIEANKPAGFQNFMSEWPVVYIITGDKEAYVGETTDAETRMLQHWQNPERRKLKEVQFISDEYFNKSVILDLESFLISHMSADGVYKLQNNTWGQRKHNYYNKNIYEKKFEKIWEELRRNQTARRTVRAIENSNLFKYSPYKTLTADQFVIVSQIIKTLVDDIEKEQESNFLVNGGAGTGKTVLGIYLLKLLSTPIDDDSGIEDEETIENLQKIHNQLKNLKIGIVVSMSNLRAILASTFRNIHGLKANMVLRPETVARSNEKFDILIVDEAHRLKTTKNIGPQIGNMQKLNEKLGLEKNEGTQLDWILMHSKHAVFFYDKTQTIKRTDVGQEGFSDALRRKKCHDFQLTTQLRCANGGQEYIDYIHDIFSNNTNFNRKTFRKYDFKMFDDIKTMTDLIKKKDKEVGLCRNLAGYAWKWNTKEKLHFSKSDSENAKLTKRYIESGLYDIDVCGEKYIWNSQFNGWLASNNSINEVGCVHTIQGFDLNYAGVIIGSEVKFDPKTNKIYIDPSCYFDVNGKNATDEKDLFKYIMNIYAILCTRGIKGTYIYACDDNLRSYLSKYIEKYVKK